MYIQNEQGNITAVCLPGCTKPCCNNVDVLLKCPINCQKVCCKIVVAQYLIQLRHGTCHKPRPHILTLKKFDLHLLPSIHKIKVRTILEPYSLSLNHGEIILKAHVGFSSHLFAASYQIIQNYFLNITFVKLNSVFPESTVRFKDQISGTVLKKSFLGGWDQRYIEIIRGEGLKSYKIKTSKPTLHIPSVRQLWTRFQVVEGKYFVIKVSYLMIKYEFAVPVNLCLIWTEAFYSMLQGRK